MVKTATLNITINDREHPALFPRDDLTEAQKALVTQIAKTAVAEYIATTSASRFVSTGDRILRLPEVKMVTGLSRATIYLSISKDQFPKSVSLGARSVGWRESEITAWVNDRLARHEVNKV